MALNIKAVLQAKGTKLVLREPPGEVTIELVTVLADPLRDQKAVD
jgi:hypothetical protein